MASMTLDPSEVQVFRNQLVQLASNLEAQLKRTDAAMEAVAAEWRDVQFQKYHDEFIEDRNLIQPLSNEINQFQEGPLQAFQRNAEEYLSL